MYSIIRFGSLCGLALVIGFYTSHLALGSTTDNFTTGEIVGYSVMFISSLAIIMGIKDYKQKRSPAPLGFMGALGVGLGISLIAAHIFILYNWFYLVFINPTFTSSYIRYSEQKIISSGLEPTVIEQQLSELADYADLVGNNFTPSMMMFATVFVIGLLFSIVSAIALRTPRK
ncbi:hypothetical protein C427_1323 [Paraglaciecola psychrophila 170]|uniref:DUF4199 domain-containing protein n=2 Tax=Paraglaciecola TaxID=1621534 RepID=K7A835_9ALTE|nr:hypothetical protein C427_1323 [Paraglaciecola psychrophila 170]GAC38467.1 hypothetical protein GPSY_2856 [Paraglaciecola psychrophila 170]